MNRKRQCYQAKRIALLKVISLNIFDICVQNIQ